MTPHRSPSRLLMAPLLLVALGCAANPTNDGPKPERVDAIAELRARLEQDRAQLESQPEPDFNAELENFAGDLHEMLAAGGPGDDYLLTDALLAEYYSPVIASVLSTTLQVSAREWNNAGERFRHGTPTLIRLEVSPPLELPAGQRMNKSVMFSAGITIHYEVDGIPSTVEVDQVLRTTQGWRALGVTCPE